MFDIGSSELLLTAIVAIIVIGPKDLPRALYKLGKIVGQARGMARHFRTGIDAMVREVELEELEKKWAAENERIMKQFPSDEDTAGQPKVLPPHSQTESVAAAESPPMEGSPAPSASGDQPSA